MLFNNKSQESGRTMIEISGVLAIMTLITVGAFALVRTGMATQKRNQVVDDIAKIVTGIRTLYAEYDNLSALEGKGADALEALGIDTNGQYPENLPANATSYYVDKNTSNNSKFDVTIKYLPEKVCGALAARTWVDATVNSYCTASGDYRIVLTYDK